MKKDLLRTAMEQNQELAQESIIGDLKNTISSFLTTTAKISEKLHELKNKDIKDQFVIKNPYWGKSFSVIGKTEVKPSDIIALLKVTNEEKSKLVAVALSAVSKTKEALIVLSKKSSLEKTIGGLGQIKDNLDSMLGDLQRNYKPGKLNSSEISISTPSINDFKVIIESLEKVLHNKKHQVDYDSVYNSMNEVYGKLSATEEYESADIEAEYIEEIVQTAFDIIATISEIIYFETKLESKIIHSTYMYLKTAIK